MTPKEFREYRESLGLTQAQLAQYLGVSRSTIGSYESGKIPVKHTKQDLQWLTEQGKLKPTRPPCFKQEADWEAWKAFDRLSGDSHRDARHPYCSDCTEWYRITMKNQDLCINPGAKLRSIV